MKSYYKYHSPIGNIYFLIENDVLLSIGFQQDLAYTIESKLNDSARKIINWLNKYFSGESPSIEDIEFALCGSEFQKLVWKKLLEIPYGETRTYGQIANDVKQELGKEHMSAQAVGGAIGRNPLTIFIPCHRVIGSNNDLVGYSGGLKYKINLLEIEGHEIDKIKNKINTSKKES